MRKHVVFIRAGASSVHRRLLLEDPKRNWDCFVNWYIAAPDETVAEYYSTEGFNKYEGFVAAWQQGLRDKGYHYIALLDDDLLFAAGDISKMFELCERYGLAISQPALRWGSNSNHPVSLWNPLTRYRQTNFVEVMMPFMAGHVVEQLLPSFTRTRSTWGIDHLWYALLEGKQALAVVDAVRVHHMKPADVNGGAFYRYLAAAGVDAWQEYHEVMQEYPKRDEYRSLPQGHCYQPLFAARLFSGLFTYVERKKVAWHRRLLSWRILW
jgi:hypothetical protein